MRGNWIEQTSTTGGTGALTLSAVTGAPGFADVFGSSGTRVVRYTILEFTDSTRAQLARCEAGIGTITLSTGSLARSRVRSAWSGTAYLPNPGSATAPSALSFGSTAANIRILCSPDAEDVIPAVPNVAAILDNIGSGPANIVANATVSVALTYGTLYYTPVLIGHLGPFSQASLRQMTTLTGTATGTIQLALHEIAADGTPGPQVFAASSISLNTLTAATYTSTALATPVHVPPGWYWQQILVTAGGLSGTPTFRGGLITTCGPGNAAFAQSLPAPGLLSGASGQTALAASGWTSPTYVGASPILVMYK